MKQPIRWLLLAWLVMLLVGGLAQAQSAGQFTLNWSSIDSGGGSSIGNSFALYGTIGQSEAGSIQTGGSFQLAGGFVQESAVETYQVYLPYSMSGGSSQRPVQATSKQIQAK